MTNPADLESLGRELIDYYRAGHGWKSQLIGLSPVILSIFALLITIVIAIKNNAEQSRRDLRSQWNAMLKISHEHPEYIDLWKTENYRREMSTTEQAEYAVFCYMLWYHLSNIISERLDTRKEFEPQIRLAVNYHVTWLMNNPSLFTSSRFWKVIERVQSEPLAIIRYQGLPTLNGSIDWDKVADNYHSLILSPLNPAMLSSADGQMANTLVQDLKARDLRGLRIADWGGGIGDLPIAIANQIQEIHNVEASKRPLELSVERGARAGIKVIPINVDFTGYTADKPFDLIVSVNSILPGSRKEVVDALASVARNLASDGEFVTILPSFDTIVQLHKYWRDHYETMLHRRFRSADWARKQADRLIEAMKREKQFDAATSSYADDGLHAQCYHTPQTIKSDFAAAGLEIIGSPRKIHYPWDVVKRFDYGFFPNAPEQIWDWYVRARRAPSPRPRGS